jgi:hypothetical protein
MLAKVWDSKARQLSRELAAAAGATSCMMYLTKIYFCIIS